SICKVNSFFTFHMHGFLLKGLTVDCTRLGSANTLFDQHFTAKKDLRSPLTNASNVAVPPFMGYIRNVIFFRQ
ncbi:MAG: hypothetical protein L0L06_08300, partial [Enterococcus sp.]|nr:hypothetical protein [Enterococcus sp.]